MRLKAISLASSVDLAQLVKDRQIASIEISGEDAFVTTREHEISATHRARHQTAWRVALPSHVVQCRVAAKQQRSGSASGTAFLVGAAAGGFMVRRLEAERQR
jgi:hypothetical protein